MEKNDPRIIEHEVRNQGIANEFFALKQAIDGIDYDALCADWCVLADTHEEETDDCWVEIGAGSDCKYISMVYVDFDSEWKNAKVSYENVTVCKENIAEGCEQVNINNLIKKQENIMEKKINKVISMLNDVREFMNTAYDCENDEEWMKLYSDNIDKVRHSVEALEGIVADAKGKSFEDRQYELKKEALLYIKSHIGEDEEHHFYVGDTEVSINGQASPDVYEGMFSIDSIEDVIAHCHESNEDFDLDLDNLSTDTVVHIADQLIAGNVR